MKTIQPLKAIRFTTLTLLATAGMLCTPLHAQNAAAANLEKTFPGKRPVELGSTFIAEFAPGLECFGVSRKERRAKVATRLIRKRKPPAAPPAAAETKPAAVAKTTTVGLYTTVSLAEIANHPMNHLMSLPKGRTTYQGVPFEFTDPPRGFETENYWGRGNPTKAEMKMDVPRPSSIRVIFTGTGAGNPAHQGKEAGVLKFGFADGSEFEASLIVGTVIRPETWSPDSGNLRTPPGNDLVKVVNVVAESQKAKRKRDATGFLDMLVIGLPASKARTSLTSITITDTSRDMIGVPDPGFEISAITVGQVALSAGTIPDPLGLNRTAVVKDKPPGITLPPIPAKVQPGLKPAVPVNLPASANPGQPANPQAPVFIDYMGMKLHPDWFPKRETKTAEMNQDLNRICLGAVQGKEKDHDIMPDKILGELKWLMPMDAAEKALPGLERSQMGGATLIMTPNWPQRSLFKRSYYGKFVEPHTRELFTEAVLVSDIKRQLVAVELICNRPKLVAWESKFDGSKEPYYDFIGMKQNGSTENIVYYQQLKYGSISCLHTLLFNGRWPIGKSLENVRWYLPPPLARKILEISESLSAPQPGK